MRLFREITALCRDLSMTPSEALTEYEAETEESGYTICDDYYNCGGCCSAGRDLYSDA
jgi:hypothetical protein